jgi:hypothetical protein
MQVSVFGPFFQKLVRIIYFIEGHFLRVKVFLFYLHSIVVTVSLSGTAEHFTSVDIS